MSVERRLQRGKAHVLPGDIAARELLRALRGGSREALSVMRRASERRSLLLDVRHAIREMKKVSERRARDYGIILGDNEKSMQQNGVWI